MILGQGNSIGLNHISLLKLRTNAGQVREETLLGISCIWKELGQVVHYLQFSGQNV